MAGSLNMVTRTVGVVMGASLGSILFARAASSDQASATFDDTFALVFGNACAVTVVCLVLLIMVREPHPRQ